METTPALPAPEKRRRVPPKVKAAVSEIVEGRCRTVTAAAKKVGLSRERLSRALGEPHIAEYLKQKASRMVAIGAGRASARLLSLIDAKSEHVSLDAARHTLAIAGIKPAEKPDASLNLQVTAGFFLDLREPEERDQPAKLGDIVTPTGIVLYGHKRGGNSVDNKVIDVEPVREENNG